MTEHEDPFETDEWKTYATHALDELVPKLAESAITVSLVPKGPSDVKFAVELGFSIMLDKPILAVIQPGTQVPSRLLRVADRIVEGPLDDPAMARRLQGAVTEMLEDVERREGGRPPLAPTHAQEAVSRLFDRVMESYDIGKDGAQVAAASRDYAAVMRALQGPPSAG